MSAALLDSQVFYAATVAYTPQLSLAPYPLAAGQVLYLGVMVSGATAAQSATLTPPAGVNSVAVFTAPARTDGYGKYAQFTLFRLEFTPDYAGGVPTLNLAHSETGSVDWAVGAGRMEGAAAVLGVAGSALTLNNAPSTLPPNQTVFTTGGQFAWGYVCDQAGGFRKLSLYTASAPTALVAVVGAGVTLLFASGGPQSGYGFYAAVNLSPPPDITAPVRVSLSEDTANLFNDARVSVTNLPTRPVQFGGLYTIADEINTASPYYTYQVSQLSTDKDLLQTHTGETLIGLLARLQPETIRQPAPLSPGYWLPEQALTYILQQWKAQFPQIQFNPVPPMYVQLSGGLFQPKILALNLAQPTTAELATGAKLKTCKDFLDQFFKIFTGYHFRADATNFFTVLRPWWAYSTPPAPVTVTADQIGLDIAASEDIKSIINLCTLKSSQYSFAAGGAVVAPGSLCFADPYYQQYNPTPPGSNPLLGNIVYGAFVEQKIPFITSVVVAEGSTLTVNVTMKAKVAEANRVAGSTDGYPNTLTLTLGNGVNSAVQTVLYYVGGFFGRGSAYIAVEVSARLGPDGSLYLRLYAPTLAAKDTFGTSFFWIVAADFSVYGTTYTKTGEVNASFGLPQSAELASVPGLGASQATYGVLPLDLTSDLISIDAPTALSICRGVVERNLNPYYVYEYNQMPPYQIRPELLGGHFQLPGGVIGELVAWDYREDNATPTGTRQSSSSRVKFRVLGSSQGNSANFTGSTYTDETTPGRAVYGSSPYVLAGVGTPNGGASGTPPGTGGNLAPPSSTGGNSSTGPKLLWELRSADSSYDFTSSLTGGDIAAINSRPFDGVSLMVTGFTLECCRPGFTLNPAAFAAELDKAAAVTKRKRAIIRASGPSDPKLNPGAWDNWIAQMAQAAAILRQKGWDGFDYDPEPYQTLSGGALVFGSSEVAAQSVAYNVPISGNASSWNYSDFGWWFLFRDPSYKPILAAIFRRYANALSSAYPGIGHGWYHGAAVGDGAAPGDINAGQGGNGFLALGYALVGMMQAVSSDGAALTLEDLNEDFKGNDLDLGAGWAARSVNYRKNLTPLASGLSRWASGQSFGHMRRKGSPPSPRTDAAGLPLTLPALYASLSPATTGYARVCFYHEGGYDWSAAELAAIAATKATL